MERFQPRAWDVAGACRANRAAVNHLFSNELRQTQTTCILFSFEGQASGNTVPRVKEEGPNTHRTMPDTGAQAGAADFERTGKFAFRRDFVARLQRSVLYKGADVGCPEDCVEESASTSNFCLWSDLEMRASLTLPGRPWWLMRLSGERRQSANAPRVIETAKKLSHPAKFTCTGRFDFSTFSEMTPRRSNWREQ